MNEFDRDNKWQAEKRDALLVPGFYEKYATEGRYVLIDKGRFASLLQRRFAVDTILQSKHGNAVAIEEKIVRWPGYRYSAYCLETDSCTVPGRESVGWMVYGAADYLLYCFEQEHGGLECHLIDFQKLRDWFHSHAEEFPVFQIQDTLNKSRGRKVPISAVESAMKITRINLVPTMEDAE